ncbi:MAG: hypothetical protein LBG70_00950, partial [Bifidobacteriaceae bacterium]|nr:hypothetical protein [Bifidobacteriaceae bacterium]
MHFIQKPHAIRLIAPILAAALALGIGAPSALATPDQTAASLSAATNPATRVSAASNSLAVDPAEGPCADLLYPDTAVTKEIATAAVECVNANYQESEYTSFSWILFGIYRDTALGYFDPLCKTAGIQ